MARNITLTLGAGLGADLGPNFNLTANVGSVTPSTATKTELTAGKSVSVADEATQVTVTSTGTCTNAITQTIPCGGTTTTTTAATTTTTTDAPTTTTTTTEASNCIQYSYTDDPANIPFGLQVRYRDCSTGDIVTQDLNTLLSIDNGNGTFTYYVCVLQGSSYSSPTCVEDGIEVSCPVSWDMGGSCGSGGTTTTTAAPTTTTTTSGGPIPCDEYFNNTGTPANNISYTDCSGTPVSNATVDPNQSICVQQGSIFGGDTGFLTNLGAC
jgi:hypothetical protein